MGTRLGEFEILRELGAGGFGTTYLAQDRALEVAVVIKEFFPRIWARREGLQVVVDTAHADDFRHFLRRFLEEARIAAQLDHPNLVKVTRYFEANGTGYFVMPYLEGETLEQRLERHPEGLDAATCIGITTPILSALAVLHTAGLLHRDIKPGNIYLRSDGQPLLIDLGAARSFVGDAGGMTAMVSHGYAPPEQYALHSEQGPYTDMYAVAAVMYRMLSGADPLESPARAIGPKATRLHLTLVSRKLPGVTAELAMLVDQGLSLAPSERPQSSAEFMHALALTHRESASPTPADDPRSNPPESRNAESSDAGTLPEASSNRPDRRSLTAGLLVAIALMVTVGLWIFRGPDPVVRPAAPAAVSGDPIPEAESTGAASTDSETIDATLRESQQASPSPATETTSIQGKNEVVVDDGTPDAMLARLRGKLPARDLVVNVALDPTGPKFVEGDRIAIGFSLREAAYPLVMAYSQDGSVTLLYPNEFSKAKRVEADRMVWIGSEQNPFRIEVAPPFGRDMIHVMAFRRHEDLQLLLDEMKLSQLTADLYTVDRGSLNRSVDTVLTRGLIVVVADAATEAKTGGWGDAVALIDSGARP